MKTKIYYQAQYSKDGKTWRAFNANFLYNVTTDYDYIKSIYSNMLKFHSEIYKDYKYHRIVKYEVSETIIEEE